MELEGGICQIGGMSRVKTIAASDSVNEIATVRIELQNTDPLIWREVEVPTSITLKVLHDVVQAPRCPHGAEAPPGRMGRPGFQPACAARLAPRIRAGSPIIIFWPLSRARTPTRGDFGADRPMAQLQRLGSGQL